MYRIERGNCLVAVPLRTFGDGDFKVPQIASHVTTGAMTVCTVILLPGEPKTDRVHRCVGPGLRSSRFVSIGMDDITFMTMISSTQAILIIPFIRPRPK
jgi:hypothetical protein